MIGSRRLIAVVMAFAILAVSAAGAAAAPKAKTTTVTCRGTATACTATVSIAGGASSRPVVIRLTARNLKLRSVTVTPARSKGAVSLSRARFLLGGSEYAFTLKTVKSNPKGAHLTFHFGR
jgi:type 1 fimbria pilin